MIDIEIPNYKLPLPPKEGYVLEPCPFCGSVASNIGVQLEKHGDYRVHCWGCGATSTDAPNANYVIWVWNRRLKPKEK